MLHHKGQRRQGERQALREQVATSPMADARRLATGLEKVYTKLATAKDPSPNKNQNKMQ
jgi:predicted O-linked N-acetylglucosamine transferase (SPINDLY family)